MIRHLSIENFKSIGDIEIYLGRVNLLAGTNSSGKSTIIQSLLLMLQNNKSFIGFNGDYARLGDYDDVRCRFLPSSRDIVLKATYEDGGYLYHKYSRTENNKLNLTIEKTDAGERDLFDADNRLIQYLSCHRLGPLPMYRKDMTVKDDIGIEGEYAVSYLDRHKEDTLEDNICKSKANLTLMGQVNYWLKYIVGAEINTSDMVGTDYVKASYNFNEVTDLRPINIGSGISYLISVIIMCLASRVGALLIIENPEIHLHPNAQSKVCEFLYFIAENNRQIIVETHSDHIFNGYRSGIVTGTMDKDKINIMFVYEKEDMMTDVMKVEIGKYGRVENQVKNLFDQFDSDMQKMVGI